MASIGGFWGNGGQLVGQVRLEGGGKRRLENLGCIYYTKKVVHGTGFGGARRKGAEGAGGEYKC